MDGIIDFMASRNDSDVDERVLLVDVANVVGSRPDGWWRDRAGAASRLLELMGGLRGTRVEPPDSGTRVRLTNIIAVVEGAARSATGPESVALVAAARDGDDEIVVQAHRIVAAGAVPVVVTADRGLRQRLPAGSEIAGPDWLNRLIGR